MLSFYEICPSKGYFPEFYAHFPRFKFSTVTLATQGEVRLLYMRIINLTILVSK
ncbi:hypothetical protein Z949_1813 [Sulfitobacter guttiformis KCTC 32187]|nr:hypothetical protein Z949_1813 [Sulfitobacter guttiformis KCTC 32187]